MAGIPKLSLMVAASGLLWLLGVFVAPLQDARPQQRLTARGTTMGVVPYSVTAFAAGDRAVDLQQVVAKELEAVNLRMSTYRDDSEVSRFNNTQSTDWFSVSPDTAGVVQRALQISEISGGAFDITVQPLVALWKFSADKSEFTALPDDETIAGILSYVGYRNLQARLDPPALRKSVPQLQIDLSAIAKGFAVDQVARRLEALGFDRYLIEVGGEVRAAGSKPDGSGWQVGIEKPVAGIRVPCRVLQLNRQSLASSGDYRNYFEFQGKRYSHTIDPRTGRPVDHELAAASVIANDCMTADAVATAMMVLGPRESMRLAAEMQVQALLLQRAEDGELTATMTPSFPGEEVVVPVAEASITRTIAVASLFFLIALGGMAVGVLFGRDRIRGSCGGIAALDNPDVTPECSLCSRAAECDDLKQELKKRQSSDAGEASV
jgi:thiamine biosynthesis lipoprotein